MSRSTSKKTAARLVCLAHVLRGQTPLRVFDEAESRAAAASYARPRKLKACLKSTRRPQHWDYPDSPHGTWTNYSVVPWLCLGRTAAVILSDEETLCRELRTAHLRALALVINCHQDRPGRAYRAGALGFWQKPGRRRARGAHLVLHGSRMDEPED